MEGEGDWSMPSSPMLGRGHASGRDRKRRTMALHWPENVWSIQVPEPDRLDGASVPK